MSPHRRPPPIPLSSPDPETRRVRAMRRGVALAVVAWALAIGWLLPLP